MSTITTRMKTKRPRVYCVAEFSRTHLCPLPDTVAHCAQVRLSVLNREDSTGTSRDYIRVVSGSAQYYDDIARR